MLNKDVFTRFTYTMNVHTYNMIPGNSKSPSQNLAKKRKKNVVAYINHTNHNWKVYTSHTRNHINISTYHIISWHINVSIPLTTSTAALTISSFLFSRSVPALYFHHITHNALPQHYNITLQHRSTFIFRQESCDTTHSTYFSLAVSSSMVKTYHTAKHRREKYIYNPSPRTVDKTFNRPPARKRPGF